MIFLYETNEKAYKWFKNGKNLCFRFIGIFYRIGYRSRTSDWTARLVKDAATVLQRLIWILVVLQSQVVFFTKETILNVLSISIKRKTINILSLDSDFMMSRCSGIKGNINCFFSFPQLSIEMDMTWKPFKNTLSTWLLLWSPGNDISMTQSIRNRERYGFVRT